MCFTYVSVCLVFGTVSAFDGKKSVILMSTQSNINYTCCQAGVYLTSPYSQLFALMVIQGLGLNIISW